MKKEQIIAITKAFVRKQLSGAEGGHDWSHTERVYRNAQRIREKEGSGDKLTIELAALLHDIADSKFHDGPETKGGEIAHDFLVEQGISTEIAGHIREIIDHLSFKYTFRSGPDQNEDGKPAETADKTPKRSIEFMIVQDADRLDAMGAIGIARAFNYGGFRKRPLYDPGVSPREYHSTDTYKRSDAPTINHFHEKLFKLKDLMNTTAGKRLAEERHRYMEEFVGRFIDEWEGRK